MGTKLTSSKADEYVKLDMVGKSVTGRFDGYKTGVLGKYGLQNFGVMTGDRGQRMLVPATTTLAPIFEENLPRLLGKQVTVTLVELRPTTKGSAMKIYSVEVEDDEPAVNQGVATAVDDDFTF